MATRRNNTFLSWIFAPPYYGVPWLVWFYALLSCLCYRNGGVFAGELTGFDDHTRMVQVLNWINGAGWYDRVITRVNAPDGFQTIWTRLVDIPFAVVIMVGQQLTDQRHAALAAAFIVPFLELAVLFLVAPYFARPLVGKKYARLITLFLMFTSVLNYRPFSVSGFHSGEVSHHAWYIILVLLLFGAAARLALGVASSCPNLMMGVAVALLLAVGIEGHPLILGALFILAITALMFNRPAVAKQTMQAMFISTILSLVLLPLHQPPSQWLTISFAEPSLIGPILTAAATLFFAAEFYLLRQFPKQKIASFISTTLVALCIGAGLIALFPQMLEGPAAALSPAERSLAFREHAEAWPLIIAAFDPVDFISLLAPSLLALSASIYALRRARSKRRKALYLNYFGFNLLAGGMAEWMARYYHHALTVACAWLLWAYKKIISRLPRNRFYALLAFGAFFILGPFWMLILPALDQDLPLVSQVLLFPAKIQTYPDLCNPVAFGEYLNEHYAKDTLLMVPGADSSRLLYYSDLKIDFLNNYPSHDKFLDNVIFFGTQDLSVAKDIAQRHRFDLVAICSVQSQAPALEPGEEPMFFERLEMGAVPFWLKPVKTGLDGYRLYQVNKSLLANQD